MAVYVIGDVVASREHADQARLLSGLADAVRAMPTALSAAPTTGDEFQAVFTHVPAALGDLAELRLRLLDDPPADRPVEVRIGIGVAPSPGDKPPDAGAPGQSDPGWWHARAALDVVAAPRRAWPALRWWLEGDVDRAPLRAVLISLETLVQRFDATDVSLARGLLAGDTARKLAAEQGITPQSVAQRLHDHGVYGFVRTLQTLAEEDT